MGQGASDTGSIDRLPDPLDLETAKTYLGDCFEQSDWAQLEKVDGDEDKVSLAVFKAAVDSRNFAPSLRAWLEMWRVDLDIVPKIQEIGVVAPADLACLEDEEIDSLGLKPLKKRHLMHAMAHAKYLQAVGLSMPSSPLGAKRAGGLRNAEDMTQSMRFGQQAAAASDISPGDTWGPTDGK
eukprot:CAMPEP_0172600554 /NCGR_PEP_ID=MMETSP1068-20121228/20738_1 /TAXON_ID=35684 /ORGANISM="Pseudopedinella elastica, Strain CCMP716" /LENGTH=180 /DNA_ID=CAMNT_0013401269 /DNA_START=41 /DNA_END=583 /DNA_ORIENTATION=+